MLLAVRLVWRERPLLEDDAPPVVPELDDPQIPPPGGVSAEVVDGHAHHRGIPLDGDDLMHEKNGLVGSVPVCLPEAAQAIEPLHGGRPRRRDVEDIVREHVVESIRSFGPPGALVRIDPSCHRLAVHQPILAEQANRGTML